MLIEDVIKVLVVAEEMIWYLENHSMHLSDVLKIIKDNDVDWDDEEIIIARSIRCMSLGISDGKTDAHIPYLMLNIVKEDKKLGVKVMNFMRAVERVTGSEFAQMFLSNELGDDDDYDLVMRAFNKAVEDETIDKTPINRADVVRGTILHIASVKERLEK